MSELWATPPKGWRHCDGEWRRDVGWQDISRAEQIIGGVRVLANGEFTLTSAFGQVFSYKTFDEALKRREELIPHAEEMYEIYLRAMKKAYGSKH